MLAAITATAVVALASAGCEKKTASLDGRELFTSVCARCHGAEGQGGLPGLGGAPAPRNFHDHAFHAQRTDEQLKLAIVNGKGVAMPLFGTTFSDAQLDAIVHYLRSFDTEQSKK